MRMHAANYVIRALASLVISAASACESLGDNGER